MLLKANQVTFGYGKGRTVLENVNFAVDEGEVVGLTAPSGYGKSTLAKILAGFVKPLQGEVCLEEDGKKLERGKGYNPVQLIVQHPEKAVNPKWKMSRVLSEAGMPPAEMIEAAGIKEEWMGRWPAELSGGELQRFCVVRALNPQTRFLIADEMTTMLDAITQVQIWKLVLSCAEKQRMGVVVISHEKALVDRLCTRVVDLTEGNFRKNCEQKEEK